jgi:hypothetical protein
MSPAIQILFVVLTALVIPLLVYRWLLGGWFLRNQVGRRLHAGGRLPIFPRLGHAVTRLRAWLI